MFKCLEFVWLYWTFLFQKFVLLEIRVIKLFLKKLKNRILWCVDLLSMIDWNIYVECTIMIQSNSKCFCLLNIIIIILFTNWLWDAMIMHILIIIILIILIIRFITIIRLVVGMFTIREHVIFKLLIIWF